MTLRLPAAHRGDLRAVRSRRGDANPGQRVRVHRGAGLEPGGALPPVRGHPERRTLALERGARRGAAREAELRRQRDGLRPRRQTSWCASTSRASVVRDRARRRRAIAAFHYEGSYLNSPNDVVVRSDGSDLLQRPRLRSLGSPGRRAPAASSASTASTGCRRRRRPSSWWRRTRSTSRTASASRPTSARCTSTTSTRITAFDVAADGSPAARPRVRSDLGVRRDRRRRRPRRDEVRRARQRLVHGPRRGLDPRRPTASCSASSRPPRSVANIAWGGRRTGARCSCAPRRPCALLADAGGVGAACLPR